MGTFLLGTKGDIFIGERQQRVATTVPTPMEDRGQ